MILDDEVRGELAEALRDSGEREICGFLLAGVDDGPRFMRTANLGAPGAFLIPHSEEIRIKRYAELRGGRIAAVVHSHSDSLALSGPDRIGICADSLPWIIVMLDRDVLRARAYSNDLSERARTSGTQG